MAMFRRARRSFKRSAKKPVQWVTTSSGFTGNTNTAIAAVTLTAINLMQTGTSSLTSGGDTFIMAQRFTVLRIVGDFLIRSTDAAIGNYTWGVMLVDENAGAADVFDPTLASNSDKSWLFLNHGILDAVGTGAGNDTNMQDLPNGPHFDIRVKRIIRPDQQLSLLFKSTAATVICCNARVLVSRPA